MKLAIKLAIRNLLGAGLRTWLSALVLSFSFVVIIWMKGIMSGWDYQARKDMSDFELGGGQYWHERYDPYDPFSLTESHSSVPEQFRPGIENGTMTPVLVAQGTLFIQGRILPVAIKGLDPKQKILHIPAYKLDTAMDAIPAVIGQMTGSSGKLATGDRAVLRWRDANGTFDASEIAIVSIFTSNVPSAEANQVYLPLNTLQDMLMLPGQATLITLAPDTKAIASPGGWQFKSLKELTKQVDEIIQKKSMGQSILYFVLLLLAMLAIFDTQVLSIFRRQKEIGTYIALGYTRKQVVGLFTVEGTMHAVLAALLATAYGMPFLIYQARAGWTMPMDASQFGMAAAQTLYPIFTLGLVVSTVLLVMLTTLVVSYWPSRRIAKMNPTEALRGKLQ